MLNRFGYGIIMGAPGPDLPPFEFDPARSVANGIKHGIDFVAAQAIWLDPRRVEVAARLADEPRRLTVGRIAGRHWAAIFVLRGEGVRIISVRRARFREVAIYEGT